MAPQELERKQGESFISPDEVYDFGMFNSSIPNPSHSIAICTQPSISVHPLPLHPFALYRTNTALTMTDIVDRQAQDFGLLPESESP